jgi:hypothetical protein
MHTTLLQEQAAVDDSEANGRRRHFDMIRDFLLNFPHHGRSRTQTRTKFNDGCKQSTQ